MEESTSKTRDRYERAALKSIIGAEYKLNSHPKCVELGIAGKVGRLMGPTKRQGFFYVLVGEDIHKLSRTAWDLELESGLLEVDLGHIIKYLSEHFVDVSIDKMKLSDLGKLYGVFHPIPDAVLSSKDIVDICTISFRESADAGSEATGKFTLREVPLLLVNSNILYKSPDADADALSIMVDELYSINLMDVISVLSLMELPLCSCGCKHQTLVNFGQTFTMICADCHKELYKETLRTAGELDSKMVRMIIRNQRRIAKYYRLKKTTVSV